MGVFCEPEVSSGSIIIENNLAEKMQIILYQV